MEDVNLMQVRGTVYTGGRDHGARRCREHTHSPLPNLKQMISGFEMQNNFSIFALDPASKMRLGDMPLFQPQPDFKQFIVKILDLTTTTIWWVAE